MYTTVGSKITNSTALILDLVYAVSLPVVHLVRTCTVYMYTCTRNKSGNEITNRARMPRHNFGLAILLLIVATVVNGQLVGRASVGTFNAFLFRGAPVFEERKELLIETVSSTGSLTPF